MHNRLIRMPNIVGGRVGLCGGTPYALRRADRLILWRSRDRHRHRSVLIAHQATFLGIAFRSPAPQLSCAWLIAFDGPTLPRRRNNRMPSAIARVGRRSPALCNPAASILVAHVSHPGSQRVSKNRMHAQETPMAPNRSRFASAISVPQPGAPRPDSNNERSMAAQRTVVCTEARQQSMTENNHGDRTSNRRPPVPRRSQPRPAPTVPLSSSLYSPDAESSRHGSSPLTRRRSASES